VDWAVCRFVDGAHASGVEGLLMEWMMGHRRISLGGRRMEYLKGQRSGSTNREWSDWWPHRWALRAVYRVPGAQKEHSWWSPWWFHRWSSSMVYGWIAWWWLGKKDLVEGLSVEQKDLVALQKKDTSQMSLKTGNKERRRAFIWTSLGTNNKDQQKNESNVQPSHFVLKCYYYGVLTYSKAILKLVFTSTNNHFRKDLCQH
jgi:hypothetical protein